MDDYVPESIEGLAAVAAVEGDVVRAYRLAGAASQMRDSMNRPAAWWEVEQLDAWILLVQRGAAPFDTGQWTREGRELRIVDAIGYATGNSDPWEQARVSNPATPTRSGLLTAREIQVARLIRHGFSNHQIAQELVIADSTAARHVANILSKLGMSSRTEVAVWAATTGVPADVEGVTQARIRNCIEA